MADAAPLSAAERAERAIARIEAALARQQAATEALTRRHAALKTHMAEAIEALDDVIAREGQG